MMNYTNGHTKTYTNGHKNGHAPANILPPHNREAEEAFVASILIDPAVVLEVHNTVKPEDFYQQHLGHIYRAVYDLVIDGAGVDPLTVGETLERRGVNVDLADLAGYLARVPTSVHAEEYGRIIRATAVRRGIIYAAGRVATMAYQEDSGPEEMLAQAQAEFMTLGQEQRQAHLFSTRQSAREFVDYLEGEDAPGITTGYIDLDRMLSGGLEPGNLYAFGGAEKMGKSAFVNWISLRNALDGRRVVRFSMEMSHRQKTRRDVGMMTGLSLVQLKTRKLSPGEYTKALAAVGELSETKMVIDDTPVVTPSHIRAVLTRLQAQWGGIDLVEIDYWQRMASDERTSDERGRLEATSQAVANIARDFNVPVIMPAQVVSKSIEARQDKRPGHADIFGSSALLKDAYLIAYLYRDDYYYPDTTDKPNRGELIIRMHREGPTGTVDLQWNGELAMYRNYQP